MPVSLDRIPLKVNRSQPAFVCSSTKDGSGSAWVQVAGELDIATRPQLVRTLRRCQLQARVVVLDLRKLEFMDSSGAHAIINATMRARRLGGRLVLVGVRRNVHRVLTLTGGSAEVDIGELDLAKPLALTPPPLAQEALSP